MLQIDRWPLNSQMDLHAVTKYLQNKDLSSILQTSKKDRDFLINSIFNNFVERMKFSEKDKTKILEKSLRLLLPNCAMKLIYEKFNITREEVRNFFIATHHFEDSDTVSFKDTINSAQGMLKLKMHPIAIELMWENFNDQFHNYISNIDHLTVSEAEKYAFIVSRIPSIKRVTVTKAGIFRGAFDELKKAGKIIDARSCQDFGAISEKKLRIIFMVTAFVITILAIPIVSCESAISKVTLLTISAIGEILIFSSLINSIQKQSAYRNFYYSPK